MNKVSLEEVRRLALINKVSVIGDFLKEALDSREMDNDDSEFPYFPDDLNRLSTDELDCYYEAYRQCIPNLFEESEIAFDRLVSSFRSTFMHEVSFTTGQV